MVELKTAFWKKAAARMPAGQRSVYIAHLKRAEDLELAIDAIADLVSRVRSSFRGAKHA